MSGLKRPTGSDEDAPEAGAEDPAPDPGERVGAGVLRTVGGIVVELGSGLIELVLAAAELAAGPLRALGRRLRAVTASLQGRVTPRRALLAVALAAAFLLGVSQLIDYRGVAIGVDAFDEEVARVAPPPQIDRAAAGSAHGYAFIPGAVLAIGALALATRRRRWRLCRVAALIGVAAVVVAIVVDRPTGLDEGEVGVAFEGAEARLLAGFWLQLLAGAGLAASSLALGAVLRRGGPARRQRRARAGRAADGARPDVERSGAAARPGGVGAAGRGGVPPPSSEAGSA